MMSRFPRKSNSAISHNSTEEIIAITNANGAVPATRTSIMMSKLYRPGGPLDLFVKQLESSAVPRPRTPAYPIITSSFQQAFMDIRDGGDIEDSLRRAVEAIDQDIADNLGYPKIIDQNPAKADEIFSGQRE